MRNSIAYSNLRERERERERIRIFSVNFVPNVQNADCYEVSTPSGDVPIAFKYIY